MLIGVPLLKRQVKTLERLCKFFQAQNLLKKRLIFALFTLFTLWDDLAMLLSFS